MRVWIIAAALSFGGCRKNPECFGTSECEPGTVCFQSECVDPRDADAGVVTFWQDVEPILVSRCQTCHTDPPQNQAPFALEDFSDTQGESSGAPIHERMAMRVADRSRPMPPTGAIPEADQQLIAAWSSAGAPEGFAPFSWNIDVEPIARASCQVGCHANPPQMGAGIPLVTYADTQIPSRSGRPVWEAMARRVNDRTAPHPPALDANSRRIIRVWAATGAPEFPSGGVVPAYDAGFPTGDSPIMSIGQPETVSSGHRSIEGLAWDPVEGVLYFADVGDQIVYRLTPPSVVDVLRNESQMSRGLRVDEAGNVVAAEIATRQVSRQIPGGTNSVIADRFRGNRFNSPAGVAVRISDGTVYFTDPPQPQVVEPRELPYSGLFRVRDGAVSLEWEGPNGTAPTGLTLSPDESRLYLADRTDAVVRAFDVGADGALSNERIFAFTGPGPQGVTVDMNGNVFVAVSAGVEVYGEDGGPWGIISTPAAPVDVAFGGADLRTLYVATASVLYAMQVAIAGTDWGRGEVQPDGGPSDANPDAGTPDLGPANPVTGAGGYQFVQGNFRFLDGPEWSASDQELLFSDWGAGGDIIYRYNGVVTMYRMPGLQTAGLAIDPSTGDLIAGEMDPRRVSRTLSDGTVLPVVERFEGSLFNGPNDVVVRTDGAIYFTDPPYGLMGRPRELAFNGLFRVAAGTNVAIAEWQGDQFLDEPNGIELSEDESLLYVTNTTRNDVSVFDVMADGSLANQRQFATTLPIPDGMGVDADGNVYVTTRDGIQVFRPDGTSWGTIPNPPGVRGSNLAFGGTDRRTVFLTTASDLYQFLGRVPGLSR